MSRLPLEGVRIIDSTYIIAMPYACGIMADLGADVIKIEGPTHVDPTRASANAYVYPDNIVGEKWWNQSGNFAQLHRGKRSLTLDLTQEEGRDVLKELIKVSDVLVENFTPRVMRRWGLDYPNVKKLKPDIIMMSNTGYGHGEGPYSSYPAQATTQEGTHGHCSVTGYPGKLPSKAGQSFVDFLSTWGALLGVATALHYRNLTGKGQWIDNGMYQLGCYWVSEYVMDWIANGRLAERIGDRHPWRAPQGCYPCTGEDRWCVISVGDDAEWAALCREMGEPELSRDPRFATQLGRREHHDELDVMISSWTRGLDRFHVMERLQAAGVPAGPVYDARDSNLDPNHWERGFLEKVTFEEERQVGTRVIMGRPWRLSKTPISVRGPSPMLGHDNRNVLEGLLGVSSTKVDELEAAVIISDKPMDGRIVTAPTLEGLKSLGRIDYHDPDYKANLGI